MNLDAWQTWEDFEAASVAEDPIIYASVPCFFSELLRIDAFLRSYTDSRGVFPSGLHIDVVTTFEWTARFAILKQTFASSLDFQIMAQRLVFSSFV